MALRSNAFHSWSFKGTVHEFGTPEYDALIPVSDRKPGSRSAIVIDVQKVGTVSVLGH